MKNIRILGDVVRIKLKEMGLPATPYIIAENLLLLAICAHFTFFLPFSDAPHSFLPLAVILIGAIYGIKSGLLGICIFAVLSLIGFPEFLNEGAELWHSPGVLMAFIPAVGLAGLSANFEWDRDLKRSLYFIGLAHLIILGGGFVWLKATNHNPLPDAQSLLLSFAPSILINTVIGGILLKIFWEAVLNYDTDSETIQ